MTVSQTQKMVWPHLFASSLDLSNTGQNTTHSYNYCEKFIDKLFTGCPSLVGITPGMASPCVQHVSWGWHVVFPSCVSSSCDSAGFDCESLRNPKLSPQKTEMLLTRLGKELRAVTVCTDPPTKTVHLLSVQGLQTFIAFYSNRCF